MKLVSVNEDPNVKMKQSEKNAKKLCQRCHNIKVVALTTTCLLMWKTCPTSDPRSLSPTLIPSASSQSHQTSLLGAVSGQVPTLHSCQVNLGNVQEVSWQLGECQQVWFHHGGGQWVRRHYRWVRQVWHHHWGLRSASGCLQLVRGQHVTKNISFVSC